jgi:hypothetical protein
VVAAGDQKAVAMAHQLDTRLLAVAIVELRAEPRLGPIAEMVEFLVVGLDQAFASIAVNLGPVHVVLVRRIAGPAALFGI